MSIFWGDSVSLFTVIVLNIVGVNNVRKILGFSRVRVRVSVRVSLVCIIISFGDSVW